MELSDMNTILSGFGIFLVGFIIIITYFKVKSYINNKNTVNNSMQLERLEYYEQQLIDMKIRLDTIDLENIPESVVKIPKEIPNKVSITEYTQKNEAETPSSSVIVPVSRHSDVISDILHTITDKAMTSRDIQITIGKTREHTSRLMKKLAFEGLVKRHTENKPYTYSITEEGLERLETVSIRA